ncbi:endonuclease/exonuclease/phosphatase family protein [Lewinella sp. W8]|uniref:endonuclease/exonuclease/phosphatase family protein n=1 Tax=Lewinella sp. W8 TaxID=2528208 RepID=UPI0010674669|nr:endonuclease/exonuclease/phosphatase family protein [Lewinella sp. W8]MTB50766.1 hypothetical protein [Lewinella sp. W8]
MSKTKRKGFLKVTFLLTVSFFTLVIYRATHYGDIETKSKDALRIGYVNLNKSSVREADMEMMANADCDIWLLAEWNGDNLPQRFVEEGGYAIVYEYVDDFTYGFLVLAKPERMLASKLFDEDGGPYACNYQKVAVHHPDYLIGFLHAPPPVPSCNYETDNYIKDALDAFRETANNQILIGDFNALPFGKSYEMIVAEEFADAFAGAKIGEGTFGFCPILPKLLRVDYCFIKGNITVERKYRFPLRSSDHGGLIVDLMIND